VAGTQQVQREQGHSPWEPEVKRTSWKRKGCRKMDHSQALCSPLGQRLEAADMQHKGADSKGHEVLCPDPLRALQFLFWVPCLLTCLELCRWLCIKHTSQGMAFPLWVLCVCMTTVSTHGTICADWLRGVCVSESISCCYN
jgi:hypothetical protein